MISSSDLNKCLKNLSRIGNRAPYDIKQKVIEIAAILNKELDIVIGIESVTKGNQLVTNLEQNQLIKDNIQLYNENSSLLKENMLLKGMLESKVQSVSSKMQNVCNDIASLKRKINDIT
jgi:hypothetical protein